MERGCTQDMSRDMCDGVLLINLLQVLTGESIGICCDKPEARARALPRPTQLEARLSRFSHHFATPLCALVRVRCVSCVSCVCRVCAVQMTIFEKMENVNKAMNWLRSKGMNMRGYGPEDILDGNVNVISAIIWYVALRCVRVRVRVRCVR